MHWRQLIILIGSSLLHLSLFSAPQGAEIVSGQAAIQACEGNLLQITAGDRAIINWESFSIDAGEMARFIQPNSRSAVLNRVTGGDISKILGTLEANGTLYLVNPQGVVFGKDAVINVGGLIASTLELSNEDFLESKELLFFGDSSAAIINYGTIRAWDGDIILLGRQIHNEGTLHASGSTALGAGREILLQPDGKTLLLIRPHAEDRASRMTQLGRIEVEGHPYSLAINHNESQDALNIVSRGGKILLTMDEGLLETAGELIAPAGEVAIQTSGPFLNRSKIDVSGESPGKITIDAAKYDQSGDLIAGHGGEISVHASHTSIQTVASRSVAPEGKIVVSTDAGGRLFTSGSYTAQEISLLGSEIDLAAAHLDASGETSGGTILIGGDFQGSNPDILNASNVYVNGATRIKADARDSGSGGKIVVWSDRKTEFYGTASAKGGALSGNGGMIEISGKKELDYQGKVDASAPQGMPGTLLLDPKNLLIDANASSNPQLALVDPNQGGGSNFGSTVTVLSNGNIAVAKINDNFVATNSGAVYLYNGTTGALISTLRGSTASDQVGTGMTALTGNGNFVIRSPSWDNNTIVDAGAVTWVNGTTGLNGSVTSINSLVGTVTSDSVGNNATTALTNGNYVINATLWDNPSPLIVNVGAVTWGSGTTGVTGSITSLNSLIGGSASDQIGSLGVTVLTGNSNYVVSSPNWDNNAVANAGAATWGNGATGTTGVVTSLNSLVGSAAADQVSSSPVLVLSNGHYVVRSPNWDNGAITNVGAATWGNGTTGITGSISSLNSLIGSTSGDQVANSASGNRALVNNANGNYVIASTNWDITAPVNIVDVGSVVLCNGATGTTGVITTLNSLHGSTANDGVGSQTVTLTNGNFVVCSSSVDSGAITNVGAATWSSGTIGLATVGSVTSINSLMGTTSGDQVGQVQPVALTNGNYVIGSSGWDDGTILNVGAATWGNGTTGITGLVSSLNSLIGSATNDGVAVGSFHALPNGNYVVRSGNWNGGAISGFGAATFGNGATGVTGVVSSLNSLTGDKAGDRVAVNVALVLNNSNYIVISGLWDNPSPAIADVGAFTLCNGTTGTTGIVSSLNSLIGSTASDQVGIGGSAVLLSNGGYAIVSSSWDNGAITNAGAVTLGDGVTGITGVLSSLNSIVGTVTQTAAPTVFANDTTNSFVVRFSSEDTTGRVTIALQDPNLLTYANSASQTISVRPSFVTQSLNGGTAVTLQANNDLTVNSAITANNAGGAGGDLTLAAGRSVAINANITTDDGDLVIIGNDLLANGVVDANRDAGSATIDIGAGVTLNTGAGDLTIELRDGAGKTFTASGNINLGAGSQLLSSGDILISSVNDIAAAGAATIQTSGVGTLILVADALFPTSPGIGTGKINLPSATLGTGGGILWIFSADRTIDTFPGTINGAVYTPGTEFVDSSTEKWATYYPNGDGGIPFKLFYKNGGTPPPPPPPPPPGPSPSPSPVTPPQLQGKALSRTLNDFYGIMAEPFQQFRRFNLPFVIQFFNVYDYSIYFGGARGFVENPFLMRLFHPIKPNELE